MHANSKGLVNNLGALRTRGLIGKGWPAVPGAALAGLAGGAS